MNTKSAFRVSLMKCLWLGMIILFLFACISVSASADGDFVVSGAGVLTQYKGSDTNIVIPSNVTSIGY